MPDNPLPSVPTETRETPPLTKEQLEAGLNEAYRIITNAAGYYFGGELTDFAPEFKSLALRAIESLRPSPSVVPRETAETPKRGPITIEFAQYINTRRARRWHGEGGVMNWTGLEWAGAMCGEAGEAANIAKKLRRVEQELDGNQHSERVLDATALVPALGRELADTFFYMLLLAERYEIDLTAAIRDAFNKKSEEMGFPERL